MAFVYSSLKYQLEDTGRGQGPTWGSMAVRSRQESWGWEGRQGRPPTPSCALTWPSCWGQQLHPRPCGWASITICHKGFEGHKAGAQGRGWDLPEPGPGPSSLRTARMLVLDCVWQSLGLLRAHPGPPQRPQGSQGTRKYQAAQSSRPSHLTGRFTCLGAPAGGWQPYLSLGP